MERYSVQFEPLKDDDSARHSSHLEPTDEQSMRFHLSDTTPINSTFHNTDGQAIYKVRTSSRMFGRTTTISRIVPNHNFASGHRDQRMRDVFGYMAKFEWKSFCSSRMRFRGREFETRTFFRKQGWSCHGRHRVFVAPDGREYKWKIGSKMSELTLNDATQTLVARYHVGKKSLLSEPQMPILDVFRPGEHIIDMILVTLVYIEKLRDDE